MWANRIGKDFCMESENRAGGSLAVFLKKNKDVVILGACIFVHTLLLYKICDFEKAMETYGDELIYYNLARCIFRGEALKVHGVAFSFLYCGWSSADACYNTGKRIFNVSVRHSGLADL